MLPQPASRFAVSILAGDMRNLVELNDGSAKKKPRAKTIAEKL